MITDFLPTQTRTEVITAAYSAEWSPVSAISPEAAQGYADQFLARFPQAALVCGSRLPAAMRIMCRVDGRRRGDQVGQFMVRSESNSRGWYLVDLLTRTCTCPDHPGVTAKGGMCKHRLAVGMQIFGPDWVLEAEIKRQQVANADFMARTIRQNAEDAAARAWAMHDRLTDQYLVISEQYTDYFAAPVEAARSAVQAAAHEAQRLQSIVDNLP